MKKQKTKKKKKQISVLGVKNPHISKKPVTYKKKSSKNINYILSVCIKRVTDTKLNYNCKSYM